MLTEAKLRKALKKDYMNDEQLGFFRDLLCKQLEEAQAHLAEAKQNLSNLVRENDDLDRAQIEEDNNILLRIVERETILIRKINQALERIKQKEYGYCEISGEPIGINRLLVRPTANVSADVKELQEHEEKKFNT